MSRPLASQSSDIGGEADSTDPDALYALAVEAESRLLSPEEREWLDRLDTRREPLEALLELLIEAADGERASRLLGVLASLWWAGAVMFFGTAAAWRERLSAPLSPLHRQTMTELLAAGRASLGSEEYEAAWQRGRDAGDAARVEDPCLFASIHLRSETGDTGDA